MWGLDQEQVYEDCKVKEDDCNNKKATRNIRQFIESLQTRFYLWQKLRSRTTQ